MSTNLETNKTLFIRLDRIGDLVTTMPADGAAQADQNTAENGGLGGAPIQTEWWIAPRLDFIAASAVPRRRAREVSAIFSFMQWRQLWRALAEMRPSAAVVFHAPWWIGALLWCARVPIRAGNRSQWHSFLFFNRGVRQRRSQSTLHELEYNFQLVEKSLRLKAGAIVRQPLVLRAPRSEGDALLRAHGLNKNQYFAVHPGMSRSALNWPTQNYVELIKRLAQVLPVAITGTASDEPYLAPLRSELNGQSAVHWLDGKLGSLELLEVLSAARAVAAPSTGVAHLAAALGNKTIGIYSPVLVQAPRRWAPLGPRALTLAPEVDCPGRSACLGKSCLYFNCLEQISVARVFDLLTDFLVEPD